MMEDTFHCPVCKCDISDDIPGMINEKDFDEFGITQAKAIADHIKLVNEKMEQVVKIRLDAVRFMRLSRWWTIAAAIFAIIYGAFAYYIWAA